MRTAGRDDQSERRRQAVAEVREVLARLYRGFVWWSSVYEDADVRYEQERRREEVVGLLGEFPRHYLSRSVWLDQGTRRKIERFVEKAEDLYSDFVADIVDRGYARTRDVMATRISRELGPLRKDAEASLESELAGTRQSRWRKRLR